MLHAVDLLRQIRILLPIGIKLCTPGGMCSSAALTEPYLEVFPDSIRYIKLLVGVAPVEFLGEARFFRSQRFAMRFPRVMLVRRPITDMAPHDDECGAIMRIEKGFISMSQ